MSQRGPPIDDLDAVLADMAARRYLNALAHLNEQDVRDAVWEAAAGNAYLQMRMLLDHWQEHGEWPGETPAETYVSLVDCMDAARSQRSDNEGRGAAQSKPGVY